MHVSQCSEDSQIPTSHQTHMNVRHKRECVVGEGVNYVMLSLQPQEVLAEPKLGDRIPSCCC